MERMKGGREKDKGMEETKTKKGRNSQTGYGLVRRMTHQDLASSVVMFSLRSSTYMERYGNWAKLKSGHPARACRHHDS